MIESSFSVLSLLVIVVYIIAIVVVVSLIVLAFRVGNRYLQWHPAKPQSMPNEDWNRERRGLDSEPE